MKLTETEVRYVANLANLTLTPEEIGRMVHDLGGILDQMDVLARVDTTGVAPMAQVLFEAPDSSDAAAGHEDGTATLRPDVERAPIGSDLAVANAPVSGGGYYKVPRVIER